jgi:hypothetical protein
MLVAAFVVTVGFKSHVLDCRSIGECTDMHIDSQLDSVARWYSLRFVICLLLYPCAFRGYAFYTPLLSSYEAEVALGESSWMDVYPMDYYADAGGKWSNYHAGNKQQVHTNSKTSINPIRARKEAKAAAAAAAAAMPKVEIAYATEE